MRATIMTIDYAKPFTLAGSTEVLPAGPYELVIQQEIIQGRGAAVHHWTAAYLTVPRTGRKSGRPRRRPLNSIDLATAMRFRRPVSGSDADKETPAHKDPS